MGQVGTLLSSPNVLIEVFRVFFQTNDFDIKKNPYFQS